MTAFGAELAERYGPQFYGLQLPEQGARVLLVLDTSKSMGRKDPARADGLSRWQTLRDEVSAMASRMAELAASPRRVPYALMVLYEGGTGEPEHSACYDILGPDSAAPLLEALASRPFTSGSNHEATFAALWPLVSKHRITHIIYLGDNDIASHAEGVRAAFEAWYALPEKSPAPAQKPLWKLKRAWAEAWRTWRPRPAAAARQRLSTQPPPLPPRPAEVVFSAVAIGQASPVLEALARRGGGEYTAALRGKPREKRLRTR